MSGLKVHPDHMRRSGSTLGDFGQKISQGGQKLQTAGQNLVSHASGDKSGFGAVISKAMGKGLQITGKVFDEGGRVVEAAGNRLHSSANLYEDADHHGAGLMHKLHPDAKVSPASHGSSHTPHTSKSSGSGRSTSRPHDPHTTSSPMNGRARGGDPVDLVSGEVVMSHVDVNLPGILDLVLRRSHVSTYRSGRSFGTTWSSTVDQRLEFDAHGVVFVADEGVILTYPHPDGTIPVLPEAGARWPLARTVDGGFTVTAAEGRTLHFLPAGNGWPLRSVVDRNGNRIDFARADDGSLTEIRHSGGYRIGVSAEQGRINQFRLLGDNDVVLTDYRYNEAGHLSEVINSSGQPLCLDYDQDGRVTGWQDRHATTYNYVYDQDGRCVRGAGSDGFLSAEFAYDPTNRTTRMTDSLGHTSTYRYNELGQVVAQTDPLGAVTTSEWDRFDRLLQRTDPLGRTTRYDYDEAGNLTTITRPDGSQIVAQYGELGLPLTTVEPDGASWRREYDERGNRIAVVDPVGTMTRYAHDERGGLSTISDALGYLSRVRCDTTGLVLAVTDPTGAVTANTRDRFGRPSAIVDPAGAVTRLEWSIEGKPVARTLPDGTTEQWSYDGEGCTISRVDALGLTTRTEMTHFDLPAAEVGPDGARTEFRYDTELRRVAVTNPLGQVWRYDYDPGGNLVRETDFDGRVQTYGYDAAGQLVERTNNAGQTIRYVYDLLGNLVGQQTANATTTFVRDSSGRLLRATNADADVVITRDQLGRVIAETVNGHTVASGYDLLGRKVLRRTPSGAESRWEYNGGNRPTALHTAGRTMRFGYDVVGRETLRQLDAATLTQTWDANHRLRTQALAVGSSLVQRRSYRYRQDGYLTGIVDQLSGPSDFTLDLAGRVTAVDGGGPAERYTYDLAGNIAQPPETPDSAHYQHDPQGRVIMRQRRRLSRKPDTWRYTWDAEDRLVEVITPDGQHWRYRYDPLGRRIAKQRLTPNGVSVAEQTDFFWDDMVLVEQVDTGRGSTTWEYEPGTFRPLSQTERGPSHDLGREWVDRQFYAIVTDMVGTPTELVDGAGNLAWHERRTLWGASLAVAPAGPTCPLRFPGQYHDPESQLDYNYHRYYDPSSGRYQSRDPLGLDGGPRPDAYVQNPTAWIDPLGLTTCPLRQYADGLRGENQASTPRVAAQYISPSGKAYYGHNAEGVPLPDHLRTEMEKIAPISNRHGACAEVNAMSKAFQAEGPSALRGGHMNAIRVRSVNSGGTAHGTPIAPCETYCQPLLRSLGITW